MSVNIVDLVMKQVGGNVPGILGSLLGESADRTQGALAGAVPAILGGLMGAASKGGGITDQIASAIGQQDDGILDNLAGAFGGGQHQQIADQGSTLLSSLLGDGVVGTLVGAIGKFSGLGGGSTKSLLGMLAPIVMSVLSREQKSQGLDTGGMMNLLASQKDNIQGAMPSDLASALGGAGFLDDLMGTAHTATSSITGAAERAVGKAGEAAGQVASAVGDAAESAGEAVAAAGAAAERAGDAVKDAASSASAAVGQGAEAAGRAAQNVASGASQAASGASAAAAGAAQSGGSWLRWLLPLIILLALLWFAFRFLGGSSVEETAQNAGDAVTSAVEATTEAVGDAADAAGDAASSAVEATTEAAGDAAEAVGDAASSAVEATTEAAGDATEAAGDATSSAVEATAEAADAAADAAGGAVDAAAGAAGDVADAASDAATSAVESMTAMVGDVDVGGGLTSAFDGLTETLSGITDTASAEAALPALEEVNSSLGSLTALADQLPADAVGGISEMVSSGVEGLDGLIASLESIPGVGDLIMPVIDQIKEKLAAFTTA